MPIFGAVHMAHVPPGSSFYPSCALSCSRYSFAAGDSCGGRSGAVGLSQNSWRSPRSTLIPGTRILWSIALLVYSGRLCTSTIILSLGPLAFRFMRTLVSAISVRYIPDKSVTWLCIHIPKFIHGAKQTRFSLEDTCSSAAGTCSMCHWHGMNEETWHDTFRHPI